MVTLEDNILVLDRTRNGDDILPLVHRVKGRRGGWYIDIGIERQDVLYHLVEAEILDDELPIRYIARNGQQAEGTVHIDELISGPEGDMCRLRGEGPAPAAILADEPQEV